MTSTNDFERDVSAWFHADAEHRVSPHLDAVLRRTRSERQRPAWSSLERWLPMQSTARFAAAPRIAWLLVVLGLVLALGVTAVFIGSRRATPSPFGQDSRGIVLYGATDGDIYALDTASNQATPLVTGEAIDTDPIFAPGGSTFAFTRRRPGESTPSLMVGDADGSDIRTLAGGLTADADIEWSPSGDRLAVIGTLESRRGLWVVDVNGAKTLVRPEVPGTGDGLLREPHWLPNAQELIFLGGPIDTGTPTAALHRIRADGSDMQTILAPQVPGPTQTSLSPDGSKVAYALATSAGSELHVVDIDTAEDAVIAFDSALDARRPQWSPDGRMLLFERYRGGTYQLTVGSVDGGSVTPVGPERPANSGGSHARFTPDGTRILAFYESDGSAWVLDPVAGTSIQLSGEIDSSLSWQGANP